MSCGYPLAAEEFGLYPLLAFPGRKGARVVVAAASVIRADGGRAISRKSDSLVTVRRQVDAGV